MIGPCRLAASSAALSGAPTLTVTRAPVLLCLKSNVRPVVSRPRQAREIAGAPAGIDPNVAADLPARLLQPLQERREPGLRFRFVGGCVHEHADAPHALALLCMRSKRPRRRATEQRDEAAPSHGLPSSG